MKLALALLPGGLILLGVIWVLTRRRAVETVSLRWLDAQARRDARAGAPWEGVTWKRARCPIRDENGIWNRHVERRRRSA